MPTANIFTPKLRISMEFLTTPEFMILLTVIVALSTYVLFPRRKKLQN